MVLSPPLRRVYLFESGREATNVKRRAKKIAQIIYFVDFTVDKINYLCYNKSVKRNTKQQMEDDDND
nr:MAG TPA: hypothetical protein [Caudoviricetes sp.]